MEAKRRFIPEDEPCAVGASGPEGRTGFSRLSFHKKLSEIKSRDVFKVDKCNEHNVSLIVIPDLFSATKIEDLIPFIISQCDNLGINVPHRNITLKDLGLKNLKFNNSSFEEKLNKIISIANSRGGKCLSGVYNSKIMKFQCECGFVWSAKPNNVINGRWCPRCAHKVPITIEDMQKIATDRGGLCLSTKYTNNSTKLEWQCFCGNVWKATYNAVQSGTWCPKCALIRRSNSKRIGIGPYQAAAERKGGRCLSTSIFSCFDKIELECAKGHRWFSRADQIKNTKKWCPECAGRHKPNVEADNERRLFIWYTGVR